LKTFAYEAVSAEGKAVKGRARAADELELDRELENRGLHLGQARVLSGTRSRRKHRIPSGELLSLTTQLAVTTGAGVPLVQALQSIARRAASPESRALLEEIVLGLEQGQSLSQALEAHPLCFPLVYQASVHAGETSGALDVILRRLARHLEWTRSMRATTLQALTYPALLAVGILGLAVILLTFVLPRILKLYPGGAQDLPSQTRTVLALSELLCSHAVLLCGGLLLGGVALHVLRRTESGRIALGRALLAVPRLGGVALQIATSRFASTASILHNAGCDVFQVLHIAGETCGNAALRSGFRRTAEGVRRGLTITESLEREPLVDPLLIQLVCVGEQTGDLGGSLSKLVEYYDDEIPRLVKRFLGFLEPALLISSAGVVGYILLAALLPIFSLYENL
jgi:type II secretory pathway component PulF